MTAPSTSTRSRPGGVDPLDIPMDDSVEAPTHVPARWSLSRLSLQWSATSVPVALLLLVGAALGPHGVSFLSPAVLSFLDPAVPVALATLGVLAGLSVAVHRPGGRRVFITASLESGLTLCVVTLGALLVGPAAATTVPMWTIALIGGVCAATSVTLPAGSSGEPGEPVRRLPDADVLLPVIVGGLALASVREPSLWAAVSLVVQSSAVALAIAAAGWLLMAKASSETEQRVFIVAGLLLLGGAADYLSLSALMAGLVAGIFWQLAGGPAREYTSRDALYLQHPFVVLVLLVAGARADPSGAALGLAVIYVLLRTAAKLFGGVAGRRIVSNGPSDLGVRLLPPGIFGVAFALNAVRALGSDLSVVLTVVVAGTIGCELLSKFAQPAESME